MSTTDAIQDIRLSHLEKTLGIAPPNACYPADHSTKGAAQRVRFHIPTADTWLILGKRAEGQGYEGITAYTNGDVLISSECSTMTLQALGQVDVQSFAGDLVARAQGSAFFSADSSSYIAGKQGTMILGGGVDLKSCQQSLQCGSPATWTPHNMSEAAASNDEAVSNISAVVSVATIVGSTLVGGLPSGFIASLGFANGLSSAINSIISGSGGAGVGIHGTDGVSITSCNSVFAYAPSEVTLSSKTSVDLASAMFASINAGLSVDILSTQVSVLGLDSIEMIAGTGAEVASRWTTLKLLGPNIKLGQLGGGLSQLPTKNITANSLVKIVLNSNNEIAIKALIKAVFESSGTMDLYSKGELSLKSDVEIDLDAKNEIEVTSGGKIEIESGKEIEISAKSKVHVDVGTFNIKVTKNDVGIGYGRKNLSSPSVRVDRSNVNVKAKGTFKCNGQKICLG